MAKEKQSYEEQIIKKRQERTKKVLQGLTEINRLSMIEAPLKEAMAHILTLDIVDRVSIHVTFDDESTYGLYGDQKIFDAD